MSLDNIRTFLTVQNPPYARMTQPEILVEVHRILKEDLKDVVTKPSLAYALMSYAATTHPDMIDVLQAVEPQLTDAQRCDVAVTFWCLTGEDSHIQTLIDFADGHRPTDDAYKASAAWALKSIGEQNQAWKHNVSKLRFTKAHPGMAYHGQEFP